eukprot:311462-Rhodomonas_salina.1
MCIRDRRREDRKRAKEEGEKPTMWKISAPYANSVLPYAVSVLPYAVSVLPYAIAVLPYAVSVLPYAVS